MGITSRFQFLFIVLLQCKLVDFLLLRKDSKMVILTVCKQMLTPGHQASLATIARIFDKLNKVYKGYLESEVQSQVSIGDVLYSFKPTVSMRPIRVTWSQRCNHR